MIFDKVIWFQEKIVWFFKVFITQPITGRSSRFPAWGPIPGTCKIYQIWRSFPYPQEFFCWHSYNRGFKIDWWWAGLFAEGIKPGGRPSWFVYEDKNDHFNRVMDYSTTETYDTSYRRKLKRFKTQRDDRTNKYQLSKEQLMFKETKLIDYLRIIRDELEPRVKNYCGSNLWAQSKRQGWRARSTLKTPWGHLRMTTTSLSMYQQWQSEQEVSFRHLLRRQVATDPPPAPAWMQLLLSQRSRY